jgi:Flp pilus assembly pilin Flp
MKNWMRKMMERFYGALNNQKGAQSIEWIALAAVVLAVLGAIATYFGNDETAVGKAVSGTLKDIIQHIGDKITE